MICRAANALWLASCLPEAARFHRALEHVREEQELVLQRLLQRNADTEFGRQHGFAAMASVRDYQERVPLRTFEEYRASIERVADGAANVLTREAVRLLEPTSGTSLSGGATKLVPYTASLQREFQRAIQPWIADLFRHDSELMGGRAYWSVSPVVTANARSRGGIPIGFEDDASYAGVWQRRLVSAVMAVPSDVRQIVDVDAFRRATLLALVRSESLRIISVWNPTFLTLLVDRFDELADVLERDPALNPQRRQALRRALGAATRGERHAILWPDLRLVSCWTDGRAADAAARLVGLFPQARIQGKGLIATEAFVSLPLVGHEGAALAVRSHFLEFAPIGTEDKASADPPRLAHELDCGQRYAVIVSTGGGLYRYQLQDVVEVVGRLRHCPLIRFVGRQGCVSDQFGEKLNEAHVAAVLRGEFDRFAISPAFAMLACDLALETPAYVLYIDSNAPLDVLDRLATTVDSRLRESFHYDYARRLGQLGPLQAFRAVNGEAAYVDAEIRRGRRAGDVKPLALSQRTDWSRVMQGSYATSQDRCDRRAS